MYIEKSTVMKTNYQDVLIDEMKGNKKKIKLQNHCRMKLNIYVVFLKIFQKQEVNKKEIDIKITFFLRGSKTRY